MFSSIGFLLPYILKAGEKKCHKKKKEKEQKATHLFFTVHGGSLCLNVLFVPQRCRFSLGDLGRIFFKLKEEKIHPEKKKTIKENQKEKKKGTQNQTPVTEAANAIK